MKKLSLLILLITLLSGCSLKDIELENIILDKKPNELINESGTTIKDRINPLDGYKRVKVDEGSFSDYLRNLSLKPHGSKVMYYDGGTKFRDYHVAVIDMDIGDRDLQQCADAIMRLRAEYLYSNERYEDIHFNFTNGFRADYKKWMEGYRIDVDGNNVSWVKKAEKSNTYKDLRNYLNMVFAYGGTISLQEELQSIDYHDVEIGDVIIQGGSPGHAVIVMDMIVNESTGEKMYLLAQSYMPAQSIHILKNLENEDISPWYRGDFNEKLYTPEWTFTKDDFKRFP